MNKQTNSVGKNYLYNLSFLIISIIVPIVTQPYLSRTLGVDSIGRYSFITSIVSYFVMFGNFGLATNGQLQVSKARENKHELSKAFFGIFISRCILFTLCTFVYFIVFIIRNPQDLIYVLFLSQIFGSMLDISWFFQGVENFKRLVIRNLFIKVLGVALIVLLIK